MPADFADYRSVLYELICEYLRDLREKEQMPADFTDYRRVFSTLDFYNPFTFLNIPSLMFSTLKFTKIPSFNSVIFK